MLACQLQRSLGGTRIEGCRVWQEREAASEVFIVKESTVPQHRPCFVYENGADKSAGVSRREPGCEQAVKGGSHLRRLSAPKLKGDESPHSPFIAKCAVESQRGLRWLGAT